MNAVAREECVGGGGGGWVWRKREEEGVYL